MSCDVNLVRSSKPESPVNLDGHVIVGLTESKHAPRDAFYVPSNHEHIKVDEKTPG